MENQEENKGGGVLGVITFIVAFILLIWSVSALA